MAETSEEMLCERVLGEHEILVKAGLRPTALPAEAWIRNFPGQERVAAALLRRFVYVSELEFEKWLEAAFVRLMSAVDREHSEPLATTLARMVFFPTQKETPSVTASGFGVCRLLRQVCGLAEDRFAADADDLQQRALAGERVVLVDDCVGSGSQLLSTAEELQAQTGRLPSGLAALAHHDGIAAARHHSIPVYFGAHIEELTSIKRTKLAPDEHPTTRAELLQFLDSESAVLDLRREEWATDGVSYPYGFRELGQTIVFRHSKPDWTLPLYWAEHIDAASEWTPLDKRT